MLSIMSTTNGPSVTTVTIRSLTQPGLRCNRELKTHISTFTSVLHVVCLQVTQHAPLHQVVTFALEKRLGEMLQANAKLTVLEVDVMMEVTACFRMLRGTEVKTVCVCVCVCVCVLW